MSLPFILIAIVILLIFILSAVLVILKLVKRNQDRVIINPDTTLIKTQSVVINEVSPLREELPIQENKSQIILDNLENQLL
jgi:hypothetical protein